MTGESRKKKNMKYSFDLARITERLKLMGIYDSIESTIMKRHGVILAEIFGPSANRTEPQARARGHVFWQLRHRFNWSPKMVADWIEMDYSGVFRSIKIEEDLYGKENRKGMRHVN